jgi:hypothetical protein
MDIIGFLATLPFWAIAGGIVYMALYAFSHSSLAEACECVGRAALFAFAKACGCLGRAVLRQPC